MCNEKVFSVIFALIYICFSVYGITHDDKKLSDMLLFVSCFAAFGIVIVMQNEQNVVYPVNQVFNV